mmetsp:Transcript_23961/g.45067  ORF Transcript_23961/g.45067 Transcript_23961/m.45067 type:complete len:207 (+) Transcript_23961:1043-1663(+)
MRSLMESSAWAASSPEGRDPSSWIFLMYSSLLEMHMDRLLRSLSAVSAASCRDCEALSSFPLSSSSCVLNLLRASLASLAAAFASETRTSEASAARSATVRSWRRLSRRSLRSEISEPRVVEDVEMAEGARESWSSVLRLVRLSLTRDWSLSLSSAAVSRVVLSFSISSSRVCWVALSSLRVSLSAAVRVVLSLVPISSSSLSIWS